MRDALYNFVHDYRTLGIAILPSLSKWVLSLVDLFVAALDYSTLEDFVNIVSACSIATTVPQKMFPSYIYLKHSYAPLNVIFLAITYTRLKIITND